MHTTIWEILIALCSRQNVIISELSKCPIHFKIATRSQAMRTITKEFNFAKKKSRWKPEDQNHCALTWSSAHNFSIPSLSNLQATYQDSSPVPFCTVISHPPTSSWADNPPPLSMLLPLYSDCFFPSAPCSMSSSQQTKPALHPR